MSVIFRVADGAPATPWLSNDIEPGHIQPAGFSVVPQLTEGQAYDFRVTVRNDGTEDAVPWTDSAAVGDLVAPLIGAAGLAWPLSGTGRTIVTAPAGGTRVQLVTQGQNYGLELQSVTGSVIAVLASTLNPALQSRRLVALYSPNGRHLVILDYNTAPGTANVSIFLAQSAGALAAGTRLMGSGTVPAYSVFLANLTFVATVNQSEYAGLNFTFVPEQRELFLTWRLATGDTAYAVLELRPKPRHTNRISITNLSMQNIGRHLFSPAGDVLALFPTQVPGTVHLFELPAGQPMTITTNGYPSGPLVLTNLAGKLSVVQPTAYGGIALTGVSPATGATTIDPPFRSRCAAEVHLWITTPAGAGSETAAGNIKLPASASKQGASAYLARVNAQGAASAVIASQYIAPTMSGPTDHRCAFAEAYSVPDAQPFQGKQRTGVAFASLTWTQLAQRNLVIVGPNSPFFVAPYAVANEGDAPVDVRVSLARRTIAELPRIRPLAGLEGARDLDVTASGFVEYPDGVFTCRAEVAPRPGLELRLQPGEKRLFAVVIDVATEPDPHRLDIALFDVMEERSDGTRGGVTMLAASAPDLIPPVLVPEEPTACPVVLTTAPFWSESPEDGAVPRQPAVPAHSDGYLIAEVRNASTEPINDLELWLESHAIPEAAIEPLVFQAVRLEASARTSRRT
jgi:hypothetical protein